MTLKEYVDRTQGTGVLSSADAGGKVNAQSTFKGWPLYSFAGDKALGDTNGQGMKDVVRGQSHKGRGLRLSELQEDCGGRAG